MHLKILCADDNVKSFYQDHKQPHAGDAGLDLFCVEETTIGPGETKTVNLGIRVSAHDSQTLENIPFLIFPRSSIHKTPLRLSNSVGLIDAGYRGPLMGLFDNIKDYPYTIKRGERLLQAVSRDLDTISFELVETLDTTSRGEGGMGSTGRW